MGPVAFSMFDSHCHLHDVRMAAVCDAALRRARAAGVEGLLLAGVDAAGWHDEVRLQRRWQSEAAAVDGGMEVRLAFGLHPLSVAQRTEPAVHRELALLAGLLAAPQADRPDAVGEIGLDARAEPDQWGRQQQAFRAQLDLARAAELPVVLHIVGGRAHIDALRVLREDGAPRAGGVVHSYSGSAEQVRDYLHLGLSISFAGPVTYDNRHRVHAAVRRVPQAHLLVETDAPDQLPAGRRLVDVPAAATGEAATAAATTPVAAAAAPPPLNEPAFLPDIIAAVARLRREDPADVARYTADNARRLFGIR